ncbi:MAG: hypothetical protein Q9222_000654 [Ikaeria aurantiellina]
MLLNFPYYSNYQDLLRMETSALASVKPGEDLIKTAVLGSGPLPMTSLCLLDLLRNSGGSVTVHNVDHNPWAVSKSSELCRKLGYGQEHLSFDCADVFHDDLDLHGFDIVYLCSLVGVSGKQKHDAILSVVKGMGVGALLVLRSAHSLRSLLYPVVELTTDLTCLGLKPLLIVHPCNHIINSVVICQIGPPDKTNLVDPRVQYQPE